MVATDEFLERIAASSEWLAVGRKGPPFPVLAGEISVDNVGGKDIFGCVTESGYRSFRLVSIEEDDEGFRLSLASNFGEVTDLQLVPRTKAAELTNSIHLARLAIAERTAKLIGDNFAGSRVLSVGLNENGGRLAQIVTRMGTGAIVACVRDVTGKMKPETLLASTMQWYLKVISRKRDAPSRVWILCEGTRANEMQRLHAMLKETWRSVIDIGRIDLKSAEPRVDVLTARTFESLWRDRIKKFALPKPNVATRTIKLITEIADENIDTIYTANGTTVRFNGLPFARVRTVMGREAAWFGTGKNMRPLTHNNFDELEELVLSLSAERIAEPANLHHRHFASSPEAWLESILRRDISRLDPNLYLSPIYHQFRFLSDRVDLMALRKDGRLVLIEVKANPDRDVVFQAASYWRKIEIHRRRGSLAEANLFGDRQIADAPAIVYIAAPAWSFHRDHDLYARALDERIEMWRFELHQDWRKEISVISRLRYDDSPAGISNL